MRRCLTARGDAVAAGNWGVVYADPGRLDDPDSYPVARGDGNRRDARLRES